MEREVINLKNNVYVLVMSDKEYRESFQPHFLDTKLIHDCIVIPMHEEINSNMFRKSTVLKYNSELISLRPDTSDVVEFSNNPELWNKKRNKKFMNDYLDEISDAHFKLILAKLLIDADDDPRTIAFVYHDQLHSYEPPGYLDVLRRFIRDTYAVDARLYKEFENEQKGCEVIIDEGMRNNLANLLYRGSAHQYNESMLYAGLLDERIDFVLPRDLDSFKVSELKNMCRKYGLPIKQFIPKTKSDGAKLPEEYIYNLSEAIRPLMNKNIFTKVETLNKDKVSIFELWRYAEVLDIFEHECEYFNKEEMIAFILETKDSILNSIEKDIYNRTKLSAMSDLELMKLAKLSNITGITPFMEDGRNLLIKAIMNAKEIVEDLDYELPSKKEMMKMTSRDLYTIYLTKLEGCDRTEIDYKTFSGFPKDLIIKFLEERYTRIMSDRVLFGTTAHDIKQMNKDSIIKFVKKGIINKDTRKQVVKQMKKMKKREMVSFACDVLGIDKSLNIKSYEIPDKSELKEMSKKSVFQIARSLDISVADFESRKDVIRYIMDLRNDLENIEKKAEKKTKLSVGNLKKMSRIELKEFCQCYGIKYDIDWGRKKLAKMILKFIDKQVKLKDLEKAKDIINKDSDHDVTDINEDEVCEKFNELINTEDKSYSIVDEEDLKKLNELNDAREERYNMLSEEEAKKLDELIKLDEKRPAIMDELLLRDKILETFNENRNNEPIVLDDDIDEEIQEVTDNHTPSNIDETANISLVEKFKEVLGEC